MGVCRVLLGCESPLRRTQQKGQTKMGMRRFLNVSVATALGLGVVLNPIDALAVETSQQATGASARETTRPSGAEIVGTWLDSQGSPVILRAGAWDGSFGFGMKKIEAKHKIANIEMLQAITRTSDIREFDGKRVYTRYAVRSDSSADQDVVEIVPVRLVYEPRPRDDYWGVGIDGVVGVLTAYCVNPDRGEICPSWVEDSLTAPALNPALRTAETR